MDIGTRTSYKIYFLKAIDTLRFRGYSLIKTILILIRGHSNETQTTSKQYDRIRIK